jgi:lipopolysaccharide transport system ATP-binding protein
MSDVVIEVENLSKLYNLGTIGSGALRRDLQNWWTTRVLKKENPFFQSASNDSKEESNEFIWALNDVSFKVERGQAIGIIGSNGSGKSTLLKIISRIVRPTGGVVRGKGKISSLLEVGTGFNPELTGRQNIYASGYILGMSKQEINQKFDEIVSFSGVERFLDTPVKRYSSGMYIRLAFAVAAHLEPEILIVDEVLAVGDADFQQKCLGKMREVSTSDGRTVLFVSHNMQAVANLCDKVIWLQKGKIREIGPAGDVINSYLASLKPSEYTNQFASPEQAPGNEFIKLKQVKVRPQVGSEDHFISVRTPIQIDAEFWCNISGCKLNINVVLDTDDGVCVFNLGTGLLDAQKGILALQTIIPGNLLNNHSYTLSFTILKNSSAIVHNFLHCSRFEVEDVRENMYYFGEWPGIIRPQVDSMLSFKPSFQLEKNES